MFSAMVAAMLLSLASVAQADVYHSRPDPNATGGITGTIKQTEGLQTVIALEPYDIRAYQAQVDRSTGRFTFRGLPPGEYDLLIKADGRVYEGFTLEHEPDQAPSPAQLAVLKEEIAPNYFRTERYFNNKWIVRLTGKDGQARMVTIMARDLETRDPSGAVINAVIVRISFVDLVKTRDVWQITTSRHILRQEVPFGSKDLNPQWRYSRQLGGLLVGDRVNDVGEIDLEALPETSNDRYAEAKFRRTGLTEGL